MHICPLVILLVPFTLYVEKPTFNQLMDLQYCCNSMTEFKQEPFLSLILQSLKNVLNTEILEMLVASIIGPSKTEASNKSNLYMYIFCSLLCGI